jgi:hypothetical protein
MVRGCLLRRTAAAAAAAFDAGCGRAGPTYKNWIYLSAAGVFGFETLKPGGRITERL